MKAIFLSLVAVGVAVGATHVVVTNKQTAKHAVEVAALQAQWDAEKDKLERELKRARGQAPRLETITETVEVTVDGRDTPQQLIQRLAKIQPASDSERVTQLREIIHLLESLKEHGQAGVPAISAFLALNQDVEYEPARTEGGEGGGGDRGGDRGRGGFGDGGRGGPGGGGPGGFGGRGGPGGFGGRGGPDGGERGDRGENQPQQ